MLANYQNIWFCGLAASGKTAALRIARSKLPRALFLSDATEIVDFICQDTLEEHHTKPQSNSFILTSSAPVYYSIDQLIAKVTQPGTKIIELSRGLDTMETIDFSYEYLFSKIPDDIKEKSLLVYIYSPLSERIARNDRRPKLKEKASAFTSFYCPSEAMERFFSQDDFFTAMAKSPMDAVIISNTGSFKRFRDQVLGTLAYLT